MRGGESEASSLILLDTETFKNGREKETEKYAILVYIYMGERWTRALILSEMCILRIISFEMKQMVFNLFHTYMF